MRTPGHYISLQRSTTQAGFVRPLSMPGVVGVQRRYVWRDLQPGYRRYNLDHLVSDVELAESMGGKLVVFIEDKTFTDERVLPDYLSQHEYRNRQGGFTAARWHGDVNGNLHYLCEAIYHRVGDYHGFGGIALQESSIGLEEPELEASGYREYTYIEMLKSVTCDFLYLNFIKNAQDRLGEVIAQTSAKMVGGPDVLPGSVPLQEHVYPHFSAAPNRVRQFSSMQFDSYEHGWTLDDMIMWAVSNLRVEVLFWNNKTWPTPKGSYTVEDAYAAIARRPVL